MRKKKFVNSVPVTAHVLWHGKIVSAKLASKPPPPRAPRHLCLPPQRKKHRRIQPVQEKLICQPKSRHAKKDQIHHLGQMPKTPIMTERRRTWKPTSCFFSLPWLWWTRACSWSSIAPCGTCCCEVGR